MKPGDKVWYLKSGQKCEATIKRISWRDAIITFPTGYEGEETGGIRISLNRLYNTESEIDAKLNKDNKSFTRKLNPYDYL